MSNISLATEPVSVLAALGLVLTSAVALAALLIPGLTVPIQAAVIVFGNSVIILGGAIWAVRPRVTPVAKS